MKRRMGGGKKILRQRLLTFLCPNCWSEVKEGEKICPKCHFEIASLDRRSYVDRLVMALRHSWADNRIWAVYILGEIGDKQAVKPLADIIDQVWNTKEFLFLKEIAVALGKIDGDEAGSAPGHLLDHPSVLIREAALKSLGTMGNGEVLNAIRKARKDPGPRLRKLVRQILGGQSGLIEE